MKNDIQEKCGGCHWYVERDSFTCCHYSPPQFQLTSIPQLEDTGRKSWWTFPYVKHNEVACGCFEPRWSDD